ncbi:MAG: hypothetical protein H6Q19_592 [Bacteroidetes bacterium]|nr:hypothetical protein [Bacteroidota bacterium]
MLNKSDIFFTRKHHLTYLIIYQFITKQQKETLIIYKFPITQ